MLPWVVYLWNLYFLVGLVTLLAVIAFANDGSDDDAKQMGLMEEPDALLASVTLVFLVVAWPIAVCVAILARFRR